VTLQLDEFKTRQRAMWAAGDFADLSKHIASVGVSVVEHAAVAHGMRVLDVACGSGNAAIPAAQAGAAVVALDIVPELLEAGRVHAAKLGVEIDWVEGDAEALPFEDRSFDRVLSTFGHMFAPRHRQTADEMTRVAREGAVLGICCWTPEGAVGDVFRAAGSYMPPPPDYASPPVLWGTEEHVREMFGSASAFEFDRHLAMIEWESIEGFADYFMDRFGPLVTARQMLGDRFAELRAEIVGIWSGWNEASDGSLRLPQEYLLSIIRL
jgi:SAM-dependent methyltransferase